MVRHSSDDEEEYTIHDLSHAPSVPEDHWHSALQSEHPPFRGTSSRSLFSASSPRHQNRRRTLSIPGHFSFRHGSSGVFSEQEKPPSLRPIRRNQASHRGVVTKSAPMILGNEDYVPSPTPLRHRALSQPLTYQEVDNANYATSLAGLSPVQSFPPSSIYERKVMFAANTDGYESSSQHQPPPTGMLLIPEDGEEKEPEKLDYIDADEEFLVEAGRAQDVAVMESSEVEDAALPSNRSRTRSDNSKWTTDSDGFYYNFRGGEDADTLSVDDEDSATLATSQQNLRKSVRFLGVFQIPLPRYFDKRRPSWNRVAFFVVEKAPCFWCCRDKTAPTYRTVLLRLNILLAFFALGQLGSALALYIIMLAPNLVSRSIEYEAQGEVENDGSIQVLTNSWNLNGCVWFLGIIGLVILTAFLLTVRAIQSVSIRVFIRLLWLLMWIIPLEIFWGVGLFDSFRVTDVWIKFWWRDRTMAWFRHKYCPLNAFNESTANAECSVPEFSDENEANQWCLTYYMSESCVGMRDQAQGEMERDILVYYYINGVWAICFIVLLFLSVKTLESIISVPLVQKSRESNVPSWLTLPIFGCTVSGLLYSFSDSSVLNPRSAVRTETSIIGLLFITAGGMFFISAMVAWCLNAFPIMNTRDKRGKTVTITGLVVVSFILLFLMATTFSIGIAFCVSLGKFPISDEQRGTIACFIDKSGSCTRCEETTERCTEWTKDDVTRIIQNQGKASATLSAIFFLYAYTNLQHAFNLRNRILDYQIDYV